MKLRRCTRLYGADDFYLAMPVVRRHPSPRKRERSHGYRQPREIKAIQDLWSSAIMNSAEHRCCGASFTINIRGSIAASAITASNGTNGER